MHKTVVDADRQKLSLNLRVRYSQTFLGFLWAFLQPAATLLILAVVYGKAVKVDPEGVLINLPLSILKDVNFVK